MPLGFDDDRMIHDQPDVDRYGIDPRVFEEEQKWCAVEGRICDYTDCNYCEDIDD